VAIGPGATEEDQERKNYLEVFGSTQKGEMGGPDFWEKSPSPYKVILIRKTADTELVTGEGRKDPLAQSLVPTEVALACLPERGRR